MGPLMRLLCGSLMLAAIGCLATAATAAAAAAAASALPLLLPPLLPQRAASDVAAALRLLLPALGDCVPWVSNPAPACLPPACHPFLLLCFRACCGDTTRPPTSSWMSATSGSTAQRSAWGPSCSARASLVSAYSIQPRRPSYNTKATKAILWALAGATLPFQVPFRLE